MKLLVEAHTINGIRQASYSSHQPTFRTATTRLGTIFASLLSLTYLLEVMRADFFRRKRVHPPRNCTRNPRTTYCCCCSAWSYLISGRVLIAYRVDRSSREPFERPWIAKNFNRLRCNWIKRREWACSKQCKDRQAAQLSYGRCSLRMCRFENTPFSASMVWLAQMILL